jgi:hypothetical protein
MPHLPDLLLRQMGYEVSSNRHRHSHFVYLQSCACGRENLMLSHDQNPHFVKDARVLEALAYVGLVEEQIEVKKEEG